MGYLRSTSLRLAGRAAALGSIVLLISLLLAATGVAAQGHPARTLIGNPTAKKRPITDKTRKRAPVKRDKVPGKRKKPVKNKGPRKHAPTKTAPITKTPPVTKTTLSPAGTASAGTTPTGTTSAGPTPTSSTTASNPSSTTPTSAPVTTTTTATTNPSPPTTTTTSTTPTTTSTPAGDNDPGDTKTECVYPANHISLLQTFDELVDTNVNCVMVYNNSASSWSSWEDPWFLGHTYSDMNWGAWATAAGTNRQLVITQDLFPSSEDSADWLENGAAGDYEQYAVALAQNLVNAGLGNSIIRLAHEANGNWYADSIPDTTVGDEEWVQFWDNTVTAMRSVPGANFKFDWTVNVGYRNIPLADWYPGNSYVDIIGVDVYDVRDTSQTGRWQHYEDESMGVQTIADFAAANDKPLSIPEWGIDPESPSSEEGGGDDPSFVQGIANLVADNDVAYQSYFFQTDELMQLENSPNSVAAYQAAFGTDGYAVNQSDESLSPATQTDPPALTLISGPQFDSTIDTTSATFTFQPAAGYTPECSVDGSAYSACTSATSEALTGLSSGFHEFDVELQNANEQETLIETDFIVASSAG